ncbi:hypothetical protein [uncultured Roseovarius sp.]|uniref:hypothetical protein n=1 Tax=Roseovarius sp. TaxID=1486281 RepID=UPI0025D84A61|nr:hypothetical protein [uncultured Roseovarius sp.]
MMRKTVFAAACLGLTAACALPPKGVSAKDIAAYDAAVASVGCKLVGESDYLPVEFQTGLTRQQVLDITAYKLSSGGAERLPDGGVKLTTGACA